MLTRPDNETTTALARMARSAEWEVIAKWLTASREACVQASLSDDPVKSRKAQGGMLVIDELFTNTRAAESSVRR